MLYAKDRNVCEGIAPLAPTNLPQAWDGYQYTTVMLARCGGIQAADTTGMLYADM
jgi:hypothetical protein